MLTTGIGVLPALYEQQNESDGDDDDYINTFNAATEEDVEQQLNFDEKQKVNINSFNLNEGATMPTYNADHWDDDGSDDDQEDEESANCLLLSTADGNSSATRSELSLSESDPISTKQNNLKTLIINEEESPRSTTDDCKSAKTETDSVILRSPSLILTTNMALDSFRRSVCIENDASVDLDAILNDLESLTQMLKSELRPVPASETAQNNVNNNNNNNNSNNSSTNTNKLSADSPTSTSSAGLPRSGSGDSGSCCPSQATFLPALSNTPSSGVELRRKVTSSAGVSPTKGVVVDTGHHHHHHHHHSNHQQSQQHTSWNSSDFSEHTHRHQHQQSPPSMQGSNRASIGDSDSAFSESGSTPTGSGAAGGSSGSVSNSGNQQLLTSPTSQISAVTTGEDESGREAKEEKIRIALEKIREAQIRKLCIRIFGPDETTSKTLFIDETTTVRQVIHLLAAKNHVEPNVNWSVVEYYPDLYVRRVMEDHESLVANMLLWKPDSPNSVRFEMRNEKYDLFARPEVYLCDGESRHVDHARRLQLIHECFSDMSVRLPHLELSLHLKHPSKKSWRRLTFFMRGSGLYYTSKSKGKASAKDLVCLAQFEHINLYMCSPEYQKKFKAPTPYGFVLKHPQLQKRCKYVHYLCADTEQDMIRWCTCIRLAKYGKQLAENYATLAQDIAAWPAERGLSAAGLLQKVTGLPPPTVTPLRHSFTPSMGSGTTLTEDRSTPSSVVMSTSAAARLAASAEQLVIISTPTEVMQHYQQHRQYQCAQPQNDYECVNNSGASPASSSERPLSPSTKQQGTNTTKKKHIRFSDDPDSLLSDHRDHEKDQQNEQVYDNALESASVWRQHHQLSKQSADEASVNILQPMSFPPPPPTLCHEYDIIAEQPSNGTSNTQHQQQSRNRVLSPIRMTSSPQPPPSLQQQDSERGQHHVTVSEMQYGIIVKPPVPSKPRFPVHAVLSPRNESDNTAANTPNIPNKPAPPPRMTSCLNSSNNNNNNVLQKNTASSNSAGSISIGRPNICQNQTNRPPIEITGELDKLLSARAARLERLWNQEEELNGEADSKANNSSQCPSSLLMASQELTSEETGTIKKRPPPPPRRNDSTSVPYHHHQY